MRIWFFMALLNVDACLLLAKDSFVIEVIDDAKQRIQSDISLLAANGASKRLGKAINGVLAVNSPYAPGDRLHVKPENPEYYESRSTECPLVNKKTVVKVTKASVQAKLKAAAQAAELRGDYGEAALVYQEISARTKAYDRKQAASSKEKVYANLGKRFSVAKPMTKSEGGESVMSVDLQREIKGFQRTCGFEPTGKLDYKTMEKLGDGPIGRHLK